jgi:hypothetical protein
MLRPGYVARWTTPPTAVGYVAVPPDGDYLDDKASRKASTAGLSAATSSRVTARGIGLRSSSAIRLSDADVFVWLLSHERFKPFDTTLIGVRAHVENSSSFGGVAERDERAALERVVVDRADFLDSIGAHPRCTHAARTEAEARLLTAVEAAGVWPRHLTPSEWR